jgi:hypothetical protein
VGAYRSSSSNRVWFVSRCLPSPSFLIWWLVSYYFYIEINVYMSNLMEFSIGFDGFFFCKINISRLRNDEFCLWQFIFKAIKALVEICKKKRKIKRENHNDYWSETFKLYLQHHLKLKVDSICEWQVLWNGASLW